MKAGNWIRISIGFILGLIVATTAFWALPKGQASPPASPQTELYERMSSVEKRVTAIEKARGEEAKERSRQERKMNTGK